MQAAHIRPVAYAGPDSVRNGLALSGAADWIVDRGLPGEPVRLLVPDRKLRRPDDLTLQSHR